MKWGVEHIIQATGGRLRYGDVRRTFDGVAIDSRVISPGQLFVAIRGAVHDAHGFVPQVVQRGVRGLVIREPCDPPLDHDAYKDMGVVCVAVDDTTRALGALANFQRLRSDIPVIGITGSNGKTTTRRMTAAILRQRFNTLATEGNLNNEIGLPLTLFALTDRHQAAVVELGINHFGEMDRLGAICRPTIGVITNAGPAHLEFLGDVQGVARAKGELLPHIDPDGYAVLNADDPRVAALAQAAPCRVCFFGTAPTARVRAENILETAGGITFDLVLPEARMAIVLPTPGRFMVANALAAAAAARLAGADAAQIKGGLEAFSPVKGRLEVQTTPNGVHIIDDTYNANPASMEAAVNTLTALRGPERGFIVLGTMLELGGQSEHLHHQVGRQAGACAAARVYAFGPQAEAILAGARQAGMAPGQLMAGAKEQIAADLTASLAPGDWVLVKGSRGMAMETVVQAIQCWARDVNNKG